MGRDDERGFTPAEHRILDVIKQTRQEILALILTWVAIIAMLYGVFVVFPIHNPLWGRILQLVLTGGLLLAIMLSYVSDSKKHEYQATLTITILAIAIFLVGLYAHA